MEQSWPQKSRDRITAILPKNKPEHTPREDLQPAFTMQIKEQI